MPVLSSEHVDSATGPQNPFEEETPESQFPPNNLDDVVEIEPSFRIRNSRESPQVFATERVENSSKNNQGCLWNLIERFKAFALTNRAKDIWIGFVVLNVFLLIVFFCLIKYIPRKVYIAFPIVNLIVLIILSYKCMIYRPYSEYSLGNPFSRRIPPLRMPRETRRVRYSRRVQSSVLGELGSRQSINEAINNWLRPASYYDQYPSSNCSPNNSRKIETGSATCLKGVLDEAAKTGSGSEDELFSFGYRTLQNTCHEV